MIIHDKTGKIIATSNPADSRVFDKMTIRDAHLVGLELEGISFNDSDLRGSDFSGSDLYGASLIGANCDLCRLVGVDLRSSSLYDASFRNSDLSGASFALDNMGAAQSPLGVDFSNANLEDADFTGAIYDETTIFPQGFDPEKRCALQSENKNDSNH